KHECLRHTEFDSCGGVLAGELPGVVEEVLQRGAEQSGIPTGFDSGSDYELDGATGIACGNFRSDTGNDSAQVKVLFLQLHARQTREVQQVLYQVAHVSGRIVDALEIEAALIIKLRVMKLQQGAAESSHAAQRAAEVVGHRIAECFQLAIHLGQF